MSPTPRAFGLRRLRGTGSASRLCDLSARCFSYFQVLYEELLKGAADIHGSAFAKKKPVDTLSEAERKKKVSTGAACVCQQPGPSRLSGALAGCII